MQKTGIVKLLPLTAAIALGVGALLLVVTALGRPVAAETQQSLGHVDGAQGIDTSGCGLGTGSQACKSIQYAIDEGYDAISVTGNLYPESIYVGRNLTLQGGWNADFTVWDPASHPTTITGPSGVDTVSIAGSDVTLDGLTVAQGDDGVHLLVGAGARLTHLKVHGTEDEGIESDGAWLILSDVEVYETGDNGILIETGSTEVHNSTVHHTGQDVTYKSRRGIYIRGGGPHTISGTLVYSSADDGIRIRNATSAFVVNNQVYSLTKDGVQIDDVNELHAAGNSVHTIDQDGMAFSGSGSATFRDNTVHDVGEDAIDFKGASGTVEDNRLYAVGDVGVQVSNTLALSVARNTIQDVMEAGVEVEASGSVYILHNAISRTVTGTAAIYVGAGVATTIDYNTVYSAAADGINFQGTRGQIRYNVVHQTGDQGINVNADDTTVLGNTLFDTQGEGLRVRGGSTAWIEGNLIHDALGPAVDGIRVEPNVTATLVLNEVYNAADDGVTFNGNAGTIDRNYLHDNGGSGLDVDAQRVTVAANRLFANTLWGLELERAALFTATNNLVGENGAGGVQVTGLSTGRLVNNTLVGGPVAPFGVGVQVLSDTVTLTSANNIVVSHTTGIAVVAGASVTTTHDDVWHNVINYSGITAGAGSIQQDPLLADGAGRDYHLLLGSPCIDAGWEVLAADFARDFEGHPRVGTIEMGADEVGVWLAKQAPASVNSGATVTYTLTVSNHYNLELTQVVITDAIPVGAHLVDAQNPHGTVVVVDDKIVRWTVDSIAPTSGTVQVSFAVTTAQTITNDRYRVVSSLQGVSSGVGPPVVTEVGRQIYLPLLLRNSAP